MTRLLSDRFLHRSAEFKKTIASSFEGMAHFAGTGPAFCFCEDCEHWIGGATTSSGRIKDGPCAEFKRMTGKRGIPFPGIAPACKYFRQKALD